jgi:hypothetical protein
MVVTLFDLAVIATPGLVARGAHARTRTLLVDTGSAFACLVGRAAEYLDKGLAGVDHFTSDHQLTFTAGARAELALRHAASTGVVLDKSCVVASTII